MISFKIFYFIHKPNLIETGIVADPADESDIKFTSEDIEELSLNPPVSSGHVVAEEKNFIYLTY